MRGTDQQQTDVFSYISPVQRVRKDHPLRPIRSMVDEILKRLSPQFSKMYAKVGRPSIPPEHFDTADFVRECRNLHMTLHVAQNLRRRQCHRWAHHATPGLPGQPEEEEAHRRMLWLAEDDCFVAQGASSRNLEGGLDVYVRVRGLQSGAHAKPDGRCGSNAVSPGCRVSKRY